MKKALAFAKSDQCPGFVSLSKFLSLDAAGFHAMRLNFLCTRITNTYSNIKTLRFHKDVSDVSVVMTEPKFNKPVCTALECFGREMP